MAELPLTSFAALLRQLRVEAGLTQEELASAAQLSPRSVSDLERGVNMTRGIWSTGWSAPAAAGLRQRREI